LTIPNIYFFIYKGLNYLLFASKVTFPTLYFLNECVKIPKISLSYLILSEAFKLFSVDLSSFFYFNLLNKLLNTFFSLGRVKNGEEVGEYDSELVLTKIVSK
jgi:hypothetical protein